MRPALSENKALGDSEVVCADYFSPSSDAAPQTNASHHTRTTAFLHPDDV